MSWQKFKVKNISESPSYRRDMYKLNLIHYLWYQTPAHPEHIFVGDKPDFPIWRDNFDQIYGEHMYIYRDLKFKKGDKLTCRFTGEIHTVERLTDDGKMVITHYETEIGKGEGWVDIGLLHYKEQIVATTNPKVEVSKIPENFLIRYINHWNSSKTDTPMKDVLVETMEVYVCPMCPHHAQFNSGACNICDSMTRKEEVVSTNSNGFVNVRDASATWTRKQVLDLVDTILEGYVYDVNPCVWKDKILNIKSNI